jgi:hypothetical protein
LGIGSKGACGHEIVRTLMPPTLHASAI